MRCLKCDYELSGLTEHRCPECGREFDPEEPSSYINPAWIERSVGAGVRTSLYIAVFPLAAVSVLILISMVDGLLFDSEFLGTPVLANFLGCLVNVILICIPLSVLLTLVLLLITLFNAWAGGWKLRLRVVAAFLFAIAIWIGSWLGIAGLIALSGTTV